MLWGIGCPACTPTRHGDVIRQGTTSPSYTDTTNMIIETGKHACTCIISVKIVMRLRGRSWLVYYLDPSCPWLNITVVRGRCSVWNPVLIPWHVRVTVTLSPNWSPWRDIWRSMTFLDQVGHCGPRMTVIRSPSRSPGCWWRPAAPCPSVWWPGRPHWSEDELRPIRSAEPRMGLGGNGMWSDQPRVMSFQAFLTQEKYIFMHIFMYPHTYTYVLVQVRDISLIVIMLSYAYLGNGATAPM